MGFKRLEKNLIDIIKEEQAKLGFRKEEIRLMCISHRRESMWTVKEITIMMRR